MNEMKVSRTRAAGHIVVSVVVVVVVVVCIVAGDAMEAATEDGRGQGGRDGRPTAGFVQRFVRLVAGYAGERPTESVRRRADDLGWMIAQGCREGCLPTALTNAQGVTL
jgi:hypothetical protein